MTRIVCFCIVAFLVTYQNCEAQKIFSTYAGVGLGRHFEQPFPYIEQTNNGRVAILLSQYARVSPKFTLGLSAMASGRLSAILGGASVGDYYDPITNTQTINYNNLNASTYLIKNKYEWLKKGDYTFYSDLGIGVTRYRYISAVQSAFSFVPEIGFSKDSFQFAATFIWGGKTPAFTAYSMMPDSIILTSIKSNRLYFTISYRLFNF